MPKVTFIKNQFPGAGFFDALVSHKIKLKKKTRKHLSDAIMITPKTLRERLANDPGGWRLDELQTLCDEIGITLVDAVAILKNDQRYDFKRSVFE